MTWLDLSDDPSLSDVTPLAGLSKLTQLHLWNSTSLTHVSALDDLTNLTVYR
ncbi:hypothetical protein [Leifsonia sp. Leaf264]|uniref:hypothetical protein n=1 Tax=Leifsonia sp. Leaf264 TaxID=1736314 RepID=UPI000A5CC91C|nr:hypothetical protein [Leifsonia sp. Leaf264]